MNINGRSNRISNTKRPFKVLITLVTLWSFLFNMVSYDFAWAARTPLEPTAVGSNRAGGPDSPGIIKKLNVDTFALPEYLGHIKDSCKGTSSNKVVIHIQDAHCNYAAQHKISDLIEYLNKEYGIDTINLEGGAKDYDLSTFTRIYDKNIRERTADYFVKEGLVNGAEYFAINNPEKAILWGVEDTKLYLDNLNVYRDSLKHKDEVDKHLNAITHILGNLKTKIYSQELLELDSKYSQYKAGTLEFKDYLAYLIQIAKKAMDIKAFTNVYLLSQTLGEEDKIDFKKANNQRDDLIDRLQKKLSKKSLEELVLKTVEFRSERISQKDFYTYLTGKANMVGIELNDLPDLQKYIVYISMYNAIDKMKIIEEMDKLENTIKEALYQNDKQRELNRLSKNLAILKNIFNISLTKEDYKYYTDNEGSFNASYYVTFINKEAPLYKIITQLDKNITDLDQYRDSISKFYEYSFKRDGVFLKNIKFGRAQKIAVIVTGGFHTENLCEIFKKQNIAYVSIMPAFSNYDGYNCPYFKLLSGTQSETVTNLSKEVSALALFTDFCKESGLVNGEMTERARTLWVELIEWSFEGAEAKVIGKRYYTFNEGVGLKKVATINGKPVFARAATEEEIKRSTEGNFGGMSDGELEGAYQDAIARGDYAHALAILQELFKRHKSLTGDEAARLMGRIFACLVRLFLDKYGPLADSKKIPLKPGGEVDIDALIELMKQTTDLWLIVGQGRATSNLRSDITDMLASLKTSSNELIRIEIIKGLTSANFDFGIAGDNQGGINRQAHENYHREGLLEQVINDIARQIGAQRRADGRFDLRSVVEQAPGKRIKTSHGEIYITEDGILVIIDSRFQKDHAGRGERAVYARNIAKAQHELTELKGWIEFAIKKGLATEEDILNGRADLGQILRNYMNGVGENLTPEQLANRRQEILQQRDRLHQQGLEAEKGLQREPSQQHGKFAIIIYADKSTDWNGALNGLVELREDLERRGYTVKNTRANSVDYLIERIESYTRERSADLIVIGAHGVQQSMHLGDGLDGNLTLQNVNKLDRIKSRLAEGGTVVLQSCSTARGEGFEGNMANAFSEIFPQAEHVFAPRVPAGPRFIFDANNQVAGIKYDNHEGAGVVTMVNLRTHDTNLTERGYDAVAGRKIAENIIETIDEADMDFIIASEGEAAGAEEAKLSLIDRLNKIFGRTKLQEQEIAKRLAPLQAKGQSPVEYSDDRQGFLEALKNIRIKDNLLNEGIARIGWEREIQGAKFDNLLVRDTSGNKFMVVLKNGVVEEVAMPVREIAQGKFEFLIVDDSEIRKIMQSKINEHREANMGAPIKQFAPTGGAKVMCGLLTEDEISRAKQIIQDDPLLANLFELIDTNFPGVNFEGYVLVEVPRDHGGFYEGHTERIFKTFEDNTLSRELYAHEITHHIYHKLQDAAARIKAGNAMPGDKRLAELFEKIQNHFREDTHQELFNYLRNSKLYADLVRIDPIYLRNEALAFIVGAFFDRETSELRSRYRITFRDVQLLVELGILPRAIYGNPELFEGVDLNMPIPEVFHQVAELCAKIGSISKVIADESILKNLKENINRNGVGNLIYLAQWLIMKGYFKEAEDLLVNIGQDQNMDYNGKCEELLLGLFMLYHNWSDTDTRNAENIFNLLSVQLQVETSADIFLKLFANKGINPKQLRKFFESHADSDQLKEMFSKLLIIFFAKLDKTPERNLESLYTLYRAIGVIYFILGIEEAAHEFFEMANAVYILNKPSLVGAWKHLMEEVTNMDERRQRLEEAMEGQGFDMSKFEFLKSPFNFSKFGPSKILNAGGDKYAPPLDKRVAAEIFTPGLVKGIEFVQDRIIIQPDLFRINPDNIKIQEFNHGNAQIIIEQLNMPNIEIVMNNPNARGRLSAVISFFRMLKSVAKILVDSKVEASFKRLLLRLVWESFKSNVIKGFFKDINIADVGLDAPEHREVNNVIKQAALEGRLEDRGVINGRRIIIVKGVNVLTGEQRAHAGIEANVVYIAEGAFNETLARHEAIELQKWQEKALELAGMDKGTDWNTLSSEKRKELKENLRQWMRDNIEEARKLESQYHNEANQQANVAGGELIPDNFVDESEKLPLKEIGAHLPVVEKAETRQAAPTMPANVENVSSRQATTVEVLGTATEGKDNEVKVIVLLPKGMRRDEVQPTQSGVNSGLSKNGFGRREDNQQVIIIEDGNVNEVRIQIKAFEDEWARRGIKGRAVVFAQQNENGTINTAGDLQKEYPTDQGNVTVIPDAYLDFNPEKNAYPDIILRVAIGRNVAFYYTGNDPTGTLAVINSLLAKVADGQPPITTINDLLNLLRPLRIRPIIYKEITDWQRAQKATATSL